MSTPEIATPETTTEANLPAYFLSLTVENFRCFKERQTLDLSDGNGRPARWTVILGENGVGKTTLLQCLASLQPVKQVMKSISDDELRTGYVPLLWHLQSSHFTYSKPAFFFHSNSDEYIAASLSTEYHIGRVFSFGKEESFRISSSKDGAISGQGSTLDNVGGLLIYAYGANRRPNGSANGLSIGSGWDTIFDIDSLLINSEDWFLNAHHASISNSTLQQLAEKQVTEIKKMLVRLLPDVHDIQAQTVHEIGKQLKVVVSVLSSYGWVPLSSLSLGYQTLITWTVDLAARLFDRYPDSPDPLAEPAVVLVDEIDLHLHPKWQRELIGFLSSIFKNTQFIVTAHSPLVVQAAEDANIVVLRREGDHVVIENNPESVRNWRVDQILASELFGQMPTRPPRVDKRLDERTVILSKSVLTEADRQRLAELEAEIGTLPTGETPQDIEAMDIIRRAAELLKKNGMANGTK